MLLPRALGSVLAVSVETSLSTPQFCPLPLPGGYRKLLYYLNEGHYGIFRVCLRELVSRTPMVVKVRVPWCGSGTSQTPRALSSAPFPGRQGSLHEVERCRVFDYSWLCRLSYHVRVQGCTQACLFAFACAPLLCVSMLIYTCAGGCVDRYVVLCGCVCHLFASGLPRGLSVCTVCGCLAESLNVGDAGDPGNRDLSLIHISEPTRLHSLSRMPSSA